MTALGLTGKEISNPHQITLGLMVAIWVIQQTQGATKHIIIYSHPLLLTFGKELRNHLTLFQKKIMMYGKNVCAFDVEPTKSTPQ